MKKVISTMVIGGILFLGAPMSMANEKKDAGAAAGSAAGTAAGVGLSSSAMAATAAAAVGFIAIAATDTDSEVVPTTPPGGGHAGH